MLTIRHILCNPKYKGWYCANKSQTVDYRSKRKVFLEESEWVMYPDPSIPAIVSEELWDRANALYKRRSEQMMSHQSAAEFHNRYPYSGKIICEEHGTSFHRQVLKSAKGEKEVWQCRVYRNRGRAACSAPQLRTTELDQIMARIFDQLAQDKQAIVDAVVKVIQSVPDEHDYGRDVLRIEEDLSATQRKKGPPAGDEHGGSDHHRGVQAPQRQLQRADQNAGGTLEVLKTEAAEEQALHRAAGANPRCARTGVVLSRTASTQPW